MFQHALASDGKDAYNDREAFFIVSQPNRLLIVANTFEGLTAAVPALLESVNYEVLGIGPNWTYVPADKKDRLAFQIKLADRPSYYIRGASPTSGQTYGVSTIFGEKLSDPADEPVDVSYKQQGISLRNMGTSMPQFPGHAMQAYHRAHRRPHARPPRPDGFLAKTRLGPDSTRPPASKANAGELWINTDTEVKVFLSSGTKWEPQDLSEVGITDMSVPFVRELVLEEMKKVTAANFAEHPDGIAVFGPEPVDGGGYATLAT